MLLLLSFLQGKAAATVSVMQGCIKAKAATVFDLFDTHFTSSVHQHLSSDHEITCDSNLYLCI